MGLSQSLSRTRQSSWLTSSRTSLSPRLPLLSSSRGCLPKWRLSQLSQSPKKCEGHQIIPIGCETQSTQQAGGEKIYSVTSLLSVAVLNISAIPDVVQQNYDCIAILQDLCKKLS